MAENPTYQTYLDCGFTPVLDRGYHPKRNPAKIYDDAKIPAFTGWQDLGYVPPTLENIGAWEREGGWTGWIPPKGAILLDIDKGQDDIARVNQICRARGIGSAVHRSNNGIHAGFLSDRELPGASRVDIRCGLNVTYRTHANQVVLAPINGRSWGRWIEPEQWPMLPDEFLPYDQKNLDDVLACLSWQIGKEKRKGTFGSYEELLSFLTFLEECGLSQDQIETAFKLVFPDDYDGKLTHYHEERTQRRLDEGAPVIGTGSFFKSLKDHQLGKKDYQFGKIEQFARELQATTGKRGKRKPDQEKETQAEKLIRIGSALPLFHDDMKEGFVELSGRIVRVRSAAFKQYLSRALWEQEKKAPNSDSLNQAQNVLEAMALFDGTCRSLFNRIGTHGGAIFYDLGDGRAVRITLGQWEIVTDHPRIFKSYPHQQPQVEPKRGGNIEKLLDYLNIAKEDHRLLAMVVLVAYFLSDIARPILHPWGDQGSGKTTLSILFKLLIDPSKVAVFFAPRDLGETVQALEHHYFLCLDNLSDIPGWLSDLLSQAVTGGGLSKRKLYTDDEDHVFQLKRCIAVNGINQLIYRPDAMDRSLLIHHSRIDPARRRTETELYTEFEQDRPYLLGAIFDTLARAMEIRPTISLSTLPRMADFALWGCAIAEALGYSRDDFLEAYQNNIRTQNSEVVGGNTLAQAVLVFMEDKEQWTGTVREAFEELRAIAYPNIAKDKPLPKEDPSFPKAANKLRKHLERIGANLLDFGVRFKIGDYSTREGVLLTLQKGSEVSSQCPYLRKPSKDGGERDEDTVNIPGGNESIFTETFTQKPSTDAAREDSEDSEHKKTPSWSGSNDPEFIHEEDTVEGVRKWN